MAFGMGVDAQGVRGIVHLTLPRSLEEYVQQVSHKSRQRVAAGQAGLPLVVLSTFSILHSCMLSRTHQYNVRACKGVRPTVSDEQAVWDCPVEKMLLYT